MLKRSTHALKQLERGSSISQRSLPILEQYFRDENMFDEVPLLGSYSTPQTPISTTPSEVRGLPGIFMDKFFDRNLLKQPNFSTQDSFFTITYLPPWHPIAAGRSTRPAVVICYKQGIELNGKSLPSSTPTARPKPGAKRSIFDYAVWRYKTKCVYKKLFMKAWNGLVTENGPRDGLYVVIARKYPLLEDHAEIQTKLSKYLRWVSSKDRKLDPEVDFKLCVSSAELAAVNRKAPQYLTPQQWNWGYTR